MKFTKIALITLSAALLATGAFKSSQTEQITKDPKIVRLWNEWKARENKIYPTPEEHLFRFGVFTSNYLKVKLLNKISQFTSGLNQFSDMTESEFKTKYTSGQMIRMMHRGGEVVSAADFSITQPPPSIDWRTKGAVTPIKNQGQCGSCWAFSTTGNLEGLQAISTGTLKGYSEQNLMDCSWLQGNKGCNGGLMTNAFKYVQKKGVMLETDYPYTARSHYKCKDDATKEHFHIGGYKEIKHRDNDALMMATAQGPVSVAVDATVLQSYNSGIIGRICGHNLDHGVLTVGYGADSTGKNFWIVKNSWGSRWGENGYFRVERLSGVKEAPCGISDMASYAVLK